MSRKTKVLEDTPAYNVIVTGRHVQITDAMRAYAVEKLAKVERLSDRIIDLSITMDIQRSDHKVDIQMKVNNFKIASHAVTDDMYASIDIAVHKLEAQLLRYKSRIQDYHTHPTESVDMDVKVIRSGGLKSVLDDINAEIEEENLRRIEDSLRPHIVVSTDRLPLKTLSVSEAIMKMDLSSDRFLLFKDETDRRLKLIYRRSDDNYGVIEPQV